MKQNEGKKKMECFEVDTKLIAYLEGDLRDAELIAFLNHVEHCPNCRKEVELFFTLIEGMNQMDGEEIEIFDFPTEFQSRIDREMKGALKRRSYRRIADRFIMVLVSGIIFVGIIYGIFHMLDYQKNYIAQEAYQYEQQISTD